jgi:acyl carrier protein
MNPTNAVVHAALAAHIGIEPKAIEDTQRLGQDLGLDPFDLVLVSLKLEETVPSPVEFPIESLENVGTVGDLTELFSRWAGEGRDRSSVA